MLRVLFIVFLVFSALIQGIAQIRLNTLTIGPNEVFELQNTDVMVVDTLILGDSSRIILNTSKKDNFIHLNKLIVGRGAAIVGKGARGIPGTVGQSFVTAGGPCRDGLNGLSATPGTAGNSGVNLFLYLDELLITGNLVIDLVGGDGGDGGKGGNGSDGNTGTRLCQGGNGGDGGAGAAGGRGGHGGNLTITSKYGANLRNLMGEKIIVRSYGGFGGLGGEGGMGGQCGLSPSKDGAQGKKGLAGLQGKPGMPGGIFYVQK